MFSTDTNEYATGLLDEDMWDGSYDSGELNGDDYDSDYDEEFVLTASGFDRERIF